MAPSVSTSCASSSTLNRSCAKARAFRRRAFLGLIVPRIPPCALFETSATSTQAGGRQLRRRPQFALMKLPHFFSEGLAKLGERDHGKSTQRGCLVDHRTEATAIVFVQGSAGDIAYEVAAHLTRLDDQQGECRMHKAKHRKQ